MRPLVLIFVTLALLSAAHAAVTIHPLPEELRSNHFIVTVNGQPVPVVRAAANYYFVNFDLDGPAQVSITAGSPDYWFRGVEVQPWRHNIRPALTGATITFPIAGPVKLSITRPGDHLADAEMLFLFANAPEVNAPSPHTPGVRYFAPGIYRENVSARAHETIYLAGGAVLFGALNVWGVDDVKILGRGIVIYDGPQTPSSDDGWQHRPDWHAITMDNAHHVEVSGIICVVRSRTWMIQMLNSRDIRYDNIKVIGGTPGNANQDGMDWLGGGDTTVRDSFFRASDDIFALYGNWLGYSEKELTTPGLDVTNILIEDCVLSTSISNIVRVGWPKKVFNSRNFTLRNSDVIHMGIGGCGVPFALFEIWADPAGKGEHSGYLFQNLRLENWYSLVQILQPNPAIRDVRFENIWALEGTSQVPSVLSGSVSGVSFQNVKIADRVAAAAASIPVETAAGAEAPQWPAGPAPRATFTVSPAAGLAADFDASASTGKVATYEWLFGDGTTASGAKTHHAFPDERGTLQDGSGRFRVLLKITDAAGRVDWSARSAVITTHVEPAARFVDTPPQPGLRQSFQNGGSIVSTGFLRIPTDGGYTFTVHARDSAVLNIDGRGIASSPKPVPQVCGSIGNAVQSFGGSMGLRKGMHAITITHAPEAGPAAFSVEWEGPAIPPSALPAEVLFH